MKAIDECAGQLASFVRIIRRIAVDKDRVLRENGRTLPNNDDAGWWDGTTDNDIISQAEALKAALPFSNDEIKQGILPVEKTLRGRATIIWNDNQWWIGPTGLVIALAGLIPFIV